MKKKVAIITILFAIIVSPLFQYFLLILGVLAVSFLLASFIV